MFILRVQESRIRTQAHGLKFKLRHTTWRRRDNQGARSEGRTPTTKNIHADSKQLIPKFVNSD